MLDVRGNGGGSREPLRRLLPHFLPAAADPRVVNVAAARIGKDDDRDRPEGYLGNRFLYPAKWTGWSEPERKAIAAVAKSFKPEWQPSGGRFSDWHYFVVSPRGDGRLAGRPTVVLMDGDCFSATDIFLGAFKGLDRVTLIGTTSGGGSGRARELRLPHSGIAVQFSSMASYLPNGRLYDGNGVEPDVRCRARGHGPRRRYGHRPRRRTPATEEVTQTATGSAGKNAGATLLDLHARGREDARDRLEELRVRHPRAEVGPAVRLELHARGTSRARRA